MREYLALSSKLCPSVSAKEIFSTNDQNFTLVKLENRKRIGMKPDKKLINRQELFIHSSNQP